MSARATPSLVLFIGLTVLASLDLSHAERWSRQVSNSDWIPLANPRSQQQEPSNLPPLPQIHQPLIPSSLPPELRQEYQQQLLQLQKTQESIQRLLLLQQELKAQQQLLQSQGFPPNGIPEAEENKQTPHHQTSNSQTSQLPELSSDVLVPPPQLSSQVRPPVYSSQNFRDSQGETVGQEQYEDYSDRQAEDYRNAEGARESLREKEKYVPEGPSGSSSADDGEEEVQVVYVPAEVLAQRGQSKNQRSRDRKQYGNLEQRQNHHQHQSQQQQRQYANHRGQTNLESTSPDRDSVPTTSSPQEDAYAREFLQQLQREHEGTDRLLKEARQKELDRLREERKEIQRQAKLQQAALEREQEIQRQREAEKKRKELARLEESAKQRELERIREAREKQRREELERSRKAQARANEEKRKQEEARQAEIDRLAQLERQKKAEIERTIKAQKELERVQKEDEERSRQQQAERTSDESPQAQPLIRSQHNEHQQTHGKFNRHNRLRNKPRQRQHHVDTQNPDSFERPETTTSAPPSPNQPPLAVYMINPGGTTGILRIADVLKTLKNAKTIDVLDNVGPDAPRVFVGPSNLEVTQDYAKFDLPYLSSIDNNRVERRVDKLPFFVAPLSFNPPPGYSKIPFPAPHIGSVVVNTLDEHVAPTQPEESYEDVGKPSLNPVIEPNSYIESSNQGVSYSTTYESPTTPSYTKYRQEEPTSTLQYQSTPSYSSVEANAPGQRYRFRQQFGAEQPSSPGSQERGPSRPAFHDPAQATGQQTFHEESPLPQSNRPSYSDESSGSTTPTYRTNRPNVVTSFTYQDGPQPVSSTPVYQKSYSQVREDSNLRHPNSQIVQGEDDQPEHRERYQQGGDRTQEYPSGPVDPYEDPALRGPTQYNLPAELPPIIPQLPGLVNSLLDEGEQAAFVNRQHPTTTTTEPTTTTTTTTTTTEAPTTTHRTRGRHRGRVVATRPSTTTTTPSSTARSRDNERTRRPVSRTRSRYTTTTEEYKETYEPTRSKVTETTQRYNSQETFRRPQKKFKSREPEESTQPKRNQVHNVQAHEAEVDRAQGLESNVRLPETTGVESNDPVYRQYNFAQSTTGLENYPVTSGDERRPEGGQLDYSQNLNYQQAPPVQVDGFRDQEEPTAQQYQELPAGDFRPPLENAPVNGFNYQTRNEQPKVTPTVPPTARDYAFYQNAHENFRASQDQQVPTETPVNSQIGDFQRPEIYGQGQNPSGIQNEDLARPQVQFPVNEDKTLSYVASDGAIYDPYSQDGQDSLGSPELAPQQAPLELTTEPTTTTTTTMEPAPVVIRQRVRGRLGGRGRPDSHVQTRPRGSQDEYVRFSAVNNDNARTTERPTTRHRENSRLRPKARHQYHGTVQVQTEGNDYVRIQAPIRTYQKTIVTPPSTTRRTTTTPAPTTTTTAYEEDSNDGLEYGFIRPPNFSPVHPVENRHQNFYRPDNQAQLQSIVPTDETAEDSSLSHTQVARNRPKYQSPNRRPAAKATTTTTAASTIAAYTERPRTRVEEPKSNRIRVRGRKPGRRRTTTTTTTTTEYVLEDTNDLPLEENYPRRAEPIQDPIDDRQALYNERFPLEAARNPIQGQNADDISYTGQDFVLNFGTDQASPEPDQTQLASQPTRQKYGQSFGTRSRAHQTSRGGQDRDIHGAESQWSTKLTSTSFQPSPAANRLPHDDRKSAGFVDSDKNKYANDQAAADAPEIITAAPEDSYVTVLVTSDDKAAKSLSGDAMDDASMVGTNYGMKMGVEGRSDSLENSTATSDVRDTVEPASSAVVDGATESSVVNGNTDNFSDRAANRIPTRRMGVRRRRVRVRVRPAPTEDFVTAESQHFNSAVNSLFHDRLKYSRFTEEPREITTTLRPPTSTEFPASSETPVKTIFEDFLEEMLKVGNDTTAETGVSGPGEPDGVTTTLKSTDSQQETTTSNVNVETTTLLQETESKAVTESRGETESRGDTESTAENESNATRETNLNDSSTTAAVTTTLNVPGKSWDSTKQYIDSIAMQSGEYLTNSAYPEKTALEDGSTGQGNEVINADYRQNDNEASGAEVTDDENYPKNHRSRWSEVRYPSDRGLFKYSHKVNLTATQLPGVVTKTEGDANVKTLSDYVKAIFDTMKNADEQKVDDLPTTRADLEDAVDVTSTASHSRDAEEASEKLTTTLKTTYADLEDVTGDPEESRQTAKAEESEETVTTETGKPEAADESSNKPEEPEEPEERRVESRTEKAEPTEPRNPEDTTKVTETTTETSTEASSTSNPELSSETSMTSTTLGTENTSVADDASTSTTTTTTTTTSDATENSPMAVVSAKLSGVLRTSTTTKVSHMTEICYRGRCVMTKPKKEFRAR